jgi:endonuclease III
VRARSGVPRRESGAARKERALRIAQRLAETYPDATCELDFRNAWELLIATILSAQCTDKMVNQVTPALFERFPDPASLAKAPQGRVEPLIRKTGFFSQKAKSIRQCAKAIVEKFGGEVPRTLDELTSLQGVGRKTASVVLGTAFGEPAVFVDTHVRRLTFRLGLTKSDKPEIIEGDVKGLLPSEQWTAFCHRLIHHGRRICFARAPRCPECPLLGMCPRIGVRTP